MAPSGTPLKIRTLAVIENDDDDEFIIRRALKKGGLAPRILRLCDAREAIAYFARTGRFADAEAYPPADVVFLDISMCGLSGFDVLSWLQDHRIEHPPFVAMLSSSDLAEDRRRAMALGADCYLVKPPTTQGLVHFAEAHAMEWPAA